MKIGGNPTTGYSQIWYSSPPDIRGLCPDGIPVIGDGKNEALLVAIIEINIRGLQFGFRKEEDGDNFGYHPFMMGRYHTDAYLLSPSVVMTHELEKPNDDDLRIFPKYAITIMSHNLNDMRNTAWRLKLPVDNLEKLMKEAVKTEHKH
jgi:hypothetical protein